MRAIRGSDVAVGEIIDRPYTLQEDAGASLALYITLF